MHAAPAAGRVQVPRGLRGRPLPSVGHSSLGGALDRPARFTLRHPRRSCRSLVRSVASAANYSFKPTHLRYTNGGTEERATVCSATVCGLTQVLGVAPGDIAICTKAMVLLLRWSVSSAVRVRGTPHVARPASSFMGDTPRDASAGTALLREQRRPAWVRVEGRSSLRRWFAAGPWRAHCSGRASRGRRRLTIRSSRRRFAARLNSGVSRH